MAPGDDDALQQPPPPDVELTTAPPRAPEDENALMTEASAADAAPESVAAVDGGGSAPLVQQPAAPAAAPPADPAAELEASFAELKLKLTVDDASVRGRGGRVDCEGARRPRRRHSSCGRQGTLQYPTIIYRSKYSTSCGRRGRRRGARDVRRDGTRVCACLITCCGARKHLLVRVSPLVAPVFRARAGKGRKARCVPVHAP